MLKHPRYMLVDLKELHLKWIWLRHGALIKHEFGLEHLDDPQLCDILEQDKVTIRRSTYHVDIKNATLIEFCW